jgi:hypothetical protein
MEKTMTENKLKHTPGPWTYFFKHKYKEWHVGLPRHGYHLDLFPDGFPGSVSEEVEANARLVSCAPEMLDALIDVCKRFPMVDIVEFKISSSEFRESKYLSKNKFYAIIEKATGLKIEDILKNA